MIRRLMLIGILMGVCAAEVHAANLHGFSIQDPHDASRIAVIFVMPADDEAAFRVRWDRHAGVTLGNMPNYQYKGVDVVVASHSFTKFQALSLQAKARNMAGFTQHPHGQWPVLTHASEVP